MTFAAYIVVHSPGPNPFPVLAVLRDVIRLANVLDVHRRFQAGPIELGEWESSQAMQAAQVLRELGAVVTVEPGPMLSCYGRSQVPQTPRSVD